MKLRLILACAVATAALHLCPQASQAISLGLINDFQTGGTDGWSHGINSPKPPANVPDVGPTGTGDNSLEIISDGSGPAGRFIAFNTSAMWTGNYVAAGVTAIQAEIHNTLTVNAGAATNPLTMKFALNGAGGWFVSAPVVVAAESGWQGPVSFDVSPSGLINLSGLDDVNLTLLNVSKVVLLSATGTPPVTSQPHGDQCLFRQSHGRARALDAYPRRARPVRSIGIRSTSTTRGVTNANQRTSQASLACSGGALSFALRATIHKSIDQDKTAGSPCGCVE